MPLANSWDIDSALIGRLSADATLTGLLPDGVWYDLAPPNAKRYLIVSLIDPTDHGVFGTRAIEDNLYLVKSVGLSTVFTTAMAKSAADRIDDLLDHQTWTVAGYAFMDCFRDPNQARLRTQRRDEIDAALIWLEGGGFYRVRVSLPDA